MAAVVLPDGCALASAVPTLGKADGGVVITVGVGPLDMRGLAGGGEKYVVGVLDGLGLNQVSGFHQSRSALECDLQRQSMVRVLSSTLTTTCLWKAGLHGGRASRKVPLTG